LVLGLLAAFAFSSPSAAALPGPSQESARGGAVGRLELQQTALESAAGEFARALAAGSAEGLGALMSPEGIRVQIEGPGSGGLSPRQAVASLVELVRRYEGGTAAVSRVEALDGSADRGFAEVVWSARAAGTSDVLQLTLFLGLAWQGEEWRIDEVRLLR
jgi:hypothetical protein